MAWPPVEARLQARTQDGRPAELRVEIRVLCGGHHCGTFVGVLHGALGDSEGPHPHNVEWLKGFRRGPDGVLVLSKPARRRWELAKLRGEPWSEFIRSGLHDRRPQKPSHQDAVSPEIARYYRRGVADLRRRSSPLAGRGEHGERTRGAALFSCPVCERRNRLDVPEDCWDFGRCPYCQPEIPAGDDSYNYTPARR